MKTKELLLVCLLLFGVCSSYAKKQKGITEEEKIMLEEINGKYGINATGDIEITKIMEFPNVSQDVLFVNASAWAHNHHRPDSNYHPTVTDDVTYKNINITGVFNLENRDVLDMAYGSKGSTDYSMNIKVKDGRLMVKISPITNSAMVVLGFGGVKTLTLRDIYPINKEKEYNRKELNVVYRAIMDSYKTIDLLETYLKANVYDKSNEDW